MYFNNSLNKVPLLRVAVPFIFGIFFFHTYEIYLQWNYLLVSLCLLLGLSFFIKNNMSLHGFNIYVSFFILGAFVVCIHNVKHDTLLDNRVDAILEIEDFPSEKNKSYEAVAKILAVYSNMQWSRIKGAKTKVFFQKDTSSQMLSPGDVIVVNSAFRQFEDTSAHYNSYYKYLKQRKIYYWIYLSSTSWQYETENKTTSNYFLRLRNNIISYYFQKGIADNAGAIVAALAFGDKRYLTNTQKENFKLAGALHILAVSGFHVGLLASLIYFATSFLSRKTSMLILRLLIIVLCVWFFAFLTGMSPSVKRAAIMISIVFSTICLSLNSNIYNSLAGAAILTLTLSPDDLFNAGFHLSYSAVVGIVYFFPKIRKYILVPYKPIQYLIDVSIVGVCAQLGTMGFALFYFKQIPVYGLLSNILVVLEAYAVAVFTIIIPIVDIFHNQASNILAVALNFFANSMHYTTSIFANMPNPVVLFGFDLKQTVLFYCLLIVFIIIVEYLYQTKKINKLRLKKYIVVLKKTKNKNRYK